MNQSKYVQEATSVYKGYVTKHLSKGCKLPKRADDSFKSGYCTEFDVSLVSRPDEASYYQSLIGVMRWMIEIG